MVCRGLEALTDDTIIGMLEFPTTCFYRFYEMQMGALFIILTFILYNIDSDKFIKSDMLSCMGISALAVIFLSLLGTTIGIIKADIFIEIFVMGMIFVVIWLLKK